MLRALILISVLCCASGQTGRGAEPEATVTDSLVRVSAQLRSYEDGSPVAYAHIRNTGLNIGAISDSLGFFKIVMRREDSLRITAISFRENYFRLPDFWPSDHYSEQILVRQKVYKIKQVSVHSMPGYEQLKREVASSIKPRTEEEKRMDFLREITRMEAVEWNKVTVGFDLSFPTKEQKSLMKLHTLLEEKMKRHKIMKKFNEDNVGELTGLDGEELNAFMSYCNFSEDFILNNSEYVILYRTKRIFRKYERHRPAQIP